MPTYKVLNYVEQEKRDRTIHGRMRLAAVLISALLFLATAALILNHAVHHAV